MLPITVELIRETWRRSHDGAVGQAPPGPDDLETAAELLRAQAIAAAQRSAEQRVVAEAADLAAHQAATDAKRSTLLAQLAALDVNPPSP